MPRKKTVQPSPISKHSFYHGNRLIEIEVRDDTCYLINRGSHRRDAYVEKLWKVMEHVVPDYLSATGRKSVHKDRDYLLRATDFAIKVESWGDGGLNGEDNSALRKRLYSDVKRELKVYQDAIAENIKNTTVGTS